jgi:hypothetical protein
LKSFTCSSVCQAERRAAQRLDNERARGAARRSIAAAAAEAPTSLCEALLRCGADVIRAEVSVFGETWLIERRSPADA